VTATAADAPAGRSRSGVAIAAACFTLWGLYPFYFRELATVGPFEIVAHRIVWSAAFLACLMPFRGRARELVATLRDRRRMATLALTSLIILANWFAGRSWTPASATSWARSSRWAWAWPCWASGSRGCRRPPWRWRRSPS
jgi:RarD protein